MGKAYDRVMGTVSKEFHHGAKEGKWNGTKCR